MKYEVIEEFAGNLRGLTPRERANLKLGIETDGPRDGSIIVAKIPDDGAYLIDGHNTLSVCEELEIKPPAPVVLKFPNRELALEWQERNQQSRRNETPEAQAARRSERIERVAEARRNGQSTRVIAEAEGVSQRQVVRDISDSGESGDSPVPTDGKVTGKDGKKQSATKPVILCERCQRVGAVEDCEACKEARSAKRRKPDSEQKDTGKPKTPKSGTPVYDDRIIDKLIGQLVRAFDDRGTARGKGQEHKNCIAAMNAVVERWNQWSVKTK